MSIRPLPIVATKLAPPKLSGASLRPDTLARIQRGGQRRLLLVQAPAGYGKTTVVAEAARTLKWRVAWYKLDILDQDPIVFAASLAESVRRIVDGFGAVLSDRLADVRDAPLSTSEALGILAAAFNDEVTGHLHIVLDDYQETANSSALNAALDYLLGSLPENIHIVVLSRYEPSFQLSRFRLADDLTVLEREDLRFSHEQTVSYLESKGLRDLRPTHLEYISTVTEGWPAGLALVANALTASRQRGDDEILANPFLKGDLYTYLAEQVYGTQSAEVRSFLRQSAALEYMTPELAEAVTLMPRAGKTLAQLTAKCLFTFRTDKGHYRYHPLFREYLKHKALQEDGVSAFQDVQLRAAHALEQAGDYAGGVELFFAAGFATRAIECAVRAGVEKWDGYPNATIASWLDRQIGEEASMTSCALLLAAQLALREAHFTTAEAGARTALTAFAAAGDKYGEYLATSALQCITYWKGDYTGAIKHARRALALSSTSSQRVHSLTSLASAHLHFAAWEQAETAWQQAEMLITTTGDSRQVIRIACARVHSLFLQGLLQEASRAGESMLPLVRDSGSPTLLSSFLNVMASVSLHRGDYDYALSLSCECLDTARNSGMQHLYPYFSEVRGQIACAIGDTSNGISMMLQAATSPIMQDDLFSLMLCLNHIGTAYRRCGEYQTATEYYRNAIALSNKAATFYPEALVRANLAFTEGLQSRDFRPLAISQVSERARHLALGYLTARCRFFSALLSVSTGDSSCDELIKAIEDLLGRGQVHFLSQELTVHVDAIKPSLATTSDTTLLARVIGAVCRHADAVQALVSMLDLGPVTARLILQTAADVMAAQPHMALVAAAKAHVDPGTRKLAKRITAGTDDSTKFPELTGRESEVLACMAAGLRNREVAEQLYLTIGTVKSYVNRIFSKLGVEDRVSAVLVYHQRTAGAKRFGEGGPPPTTDATKC